MREAVSKVLDLNLKDDYTKSEINDYIFVIKDYNIKNEISRLEVELRGTTSTEKKASIAQRMVELRKMEQERSYD